MPGWHGLSSKVAIPVRQSYLAIMPTACCTNASRPARCRRARKSSRQSQIDVLARWIDQGARTVHEEPASLPPGNTFSDEERNHWSFQPIRRPPLPEVRNPALVRSPIDAFLLAALEAKGLSFGPPADRPTLIRRLYFDLTGLPPSPAAVERFVNDSAPDAYERLVDELLASPAYGERWGRHWLDVVGYADSDGYSGMDSPRKWAYRYRDYVIRALNNDKPWNEFLVEQLAGDELLTPPLANLTPEQADRLIATGMLRMGPDGTSDGAVDQNLARNDVIANTIKIVSIRRARAYGRMCPVPRSSLRSDLARRLLSHASDLRTGVRLEELAVARRPAG